MEKLPKNEILEYRPDTLEAVRKEVNLDKQKIDESVDLLLDWLQKQTHFTKKDYSRVYLELTLVTCKGSVERTKQRLDKLTTFRTLMPDFFNISDVKKEFATLNKYIDCTVLPKLTHDHQRVCLLKFIADNFDSNDMLNFYKYVALHAEYLKINEYATGFVMVLDCREVNPLNIVTAMSPLLLKKVYTLVTEGYGMRIKSINFITTSKLIDTLVMLFKQVTTAKVGSRITVHNPIDSLFKSLPQEIFPIEYGGKEKPLREQHDQWLDVLASEENMDHFREMRNAVTIESNRVPDHFNENYLGIPGSFRALTVD